MKWYVKQGKKISPEKQAQWDHFSQTFGTSARPLGTGPISKTVVTNARQARRWKVPGKKKRKNYARARS